MAKVVENFMPKVMTFRTGVCKTGDSSSTFLNMAFLAARHRDIAVALAVRQATPAVTCHF